MTKERVLHYLKVYKEFVATSISQETSFRLNLILLIILDLFFFLTAITSIHFIYDHITTIGPWNRDQMLFFLSFMLVVDGIHMAILSTNFWILADHLKTGNLDFLLIKPVSSLFSVFFRHFRPSGFLSVPFVVGVLIYYGIKVSLSWTNWLLLPVFIILSLVLLTLIEIVITTSMFWTIEGIGINFLRMQFQQLSRWPYFVYRPLMRKFLLAVIPVLLIGSAPVNFIFETEKWRYLGGMILAIFFFGILTRKLWNLGLKGYESASS